MDEWRVTVVRSTPEGYVKSQSATCPAEWEVEQAVYQGLAMMSGVEPRIVGFHVDRATHPADDVAANIPPLREGVVQVQRKRLE